MIYKFQFDLVNTKEIVLLIVINLFTRTQDKYRKGRINYTEICITKVNALLPLNIRPLK